MDQLKQLQKVAGQRDALYRAGQQFLEVWRRQTKYHYTDRELVAAVRDLIVAVEGMDQ